MRITRKSITLVGNSKDDIAEVLNKVQEALNELGVKVVIGSGNYTYNKEEPFCIDINLDVQS